MRLRIAIPEEHVTPDVINAGLEATTRLDMQQLQRGEAPLAMTAIGNGKVKWKPEDNPGEEHFDPAKTVADRGWGDCDDLAPWQAASLRVTGEDPHAKAIVVKSGPWTWHAVVQRGDGAIEDPSRAAGMGQTAVSGEGMPYGCSPSVTAPITRGVASVGVQQYGGIWVARADLPWANAPEYAWAVEAAARFPRAAVNRAVVGACVVGWQAGMADPYDLAKLFVANSVAQGIDAREILSTMHAIGMPVDAPSFNRAVMVGASLATCKRRSAASL